MINRNHLLFPCKAGHRQTFISITSQQTNCQSNKNSILVINYCSATGLSAPLSVCVCVCIYNINLHVYKLNIDVWPATAKARNPFTPCPNQTCPTLEVHFANAPFAGQRAAVLGSNPLRRGWQQKKKKGTGTRPSTWTWQQWTSGSTHTFFITVVVVVVAVHVASWQHDAAAPMLDKRKCTADILIVKRCVCVRVCAYRIGVHKLTT